MSDEQINTIINHEMALEDSHPRGEKPKYFSEIIEEDGSIHLWFSAKKTCLHLAIDKATSTIVGAWFDYQEIGVELETSSVSQAKGLIECTNGTFQGRLVNELKLNSITTIEEANKYLLEVFVPEFNKRFAMDYKKFKSVFEQASSLEKINYTLAILTSRKIFSREKESFFDLYLN